MNAPEPQPRRRATGEFAPAGRLDWPATVVRGPLLWRYVISLAVTHALALLVLLPWLFSWTSVVLFAVGVIFFGQGINLGYHRLLAHNSLAVPKWLERAIVVLALCNSQDTPVKWVTSHRHHHKFSDVQADTHSPLAGFLWSHMGWLFFHNSATRGVLAYKTYAHDLIDDPFYRRLERDWRAGRDLPRARLPDLRDRRRHRLDRDGHFRRRHPTRLELPRVGRHPAHGRGLAHHLVDQFADAPVRLSLLRDAREQPQQLAARLHRLGRGLAQ
jgi:hypothetical protein